jgi:hypothetical protein
MPSYIDPKFVHVEPRGGSVAGVVLLAVAVALAVVAVTSAAFAIAVWVAIGVVSALCIAGVALAVRELRHPQWGPLWRPDAEEPAGIEGRVVEKAPVPALPVAARRAIEGPRAVHYHVHLHAAPDYQPALEEDQ